MTDHRIALRILRDALEKAYQTGGYHDGQVKVLQERIDYERTERARILMPEEKLVRDRDMHARERDGWAKHREALRDSIAVLEADTAGEGDV